MSISTFFILKSIPIVVMKVGEKESFAYLSKRQVLPTPERRKLERGRGGKGCNSVRMCVGGVNEVDTADPTVEQR